VSRRCPTCEQSWVTPSAQPASVLVRAQLLVTAAQSDVMASSRNGTVFFGALMIMMLNGMGNRFWQRIGGLSALFLLLAWFLPWLTVAQVQTPAAPDPPPASPAPDASPRPGGRHLQGQGQDDGGPRPVLGRIAAIQEGALRITRPDGSEQTVKITPKTEFRKDREPAKLKDFQVGDGILVRGKENADDSSITAEMIAGRSGNGPNGPNRQNPVGTLGKDFVMGEVKAMDPPSITVMRTDNVKQIFELNEDTSLRKGRESVTMADVQVGDHIFARGALQDNQFVPKTVMVIAPEQWKRMQEMGVTSAAAGKATQQGGAPSEPTEPPN